MKKHEFLYGPCELYDVNSKERSAVFEITNDEINRGAIVNRTKGIDYKSFAENPTVLFNHIPELYVGRSAWPVKVETTGENSSRMIAKVMFGNSDFAERIRLDVEDENSGLKHASIGIDPVEGFYMQDAEKAYKEDFGRKPKRQLYKYNRSSLLAEWSIVPIAMNSKADVEGYSLNMGYLREVYSDLDPTTKNSIALHIIETYMDRLEKLEAKSHSISQEGAGVVTSNAGTGEKPEGGSASIVGASMVIIDMGSAINRINGIFRGN